jgi:hypothetical protein
VPASAGNAALARAVAAGRAPARLPPFAAGNRAIAQFIGRGPPTTPAAAGDTALTELREALDETKPYERERLLGLCLKHGKRYDELAKAYAPQDLEHDIRFRMRDSRDAARALAYLRHGELRLADKLFIACIGAGTDEATLWRLLPDASAALAATTADFKADYAKDYPDEAPLLGKGGKGEPNAIAGMLDDELSRDEFVKGMALLTFGKLDKVDELRMAIAAVPFSEDNLLRALDAVAGTLPKDDAAGNALEKAYWQRHGRLFEPDLALVAPPGSAAAKRADLILHGRYTVKERVKLAVEGLGTSWKEIWEAFASAGKDELAALKQEWDAGGEIKRLITGELTATKADERRIEAILKAGTSANLSIDDRLTALGIEVDATDDVVRAVLRDPSVEAAFVAGVADPEFRARFTGGEVRAIAVSAANTLTKGSWRDRLDLAARVDSSEGLQRLVLQPGVTDTDRDAVRNDPTLMARLRAVKGFEYVEQALAPKDPVARRNWLKEKYKHDKSWASADSDTAKAYEDEMRQLDATLGDAKSGDDLTDAQKAKAGAQLKDAESALTTYLAVRDELDALAVQVLSVAAGVLLTMATGGAGAAITAELVSAQVALQVARVALINGLLNVAIQKAVKGDRFNVESAEGALVFATGAVQGATMVVGSRAALTMLSAEYRLATTEVARKAAASGFDAGAKGAAKTMLESGLGGGASGAFETAANKETWSSGFTEGVKSVAGKALESTFVAAGAAGAIEGLKLSLFGGAKAEGGAGAKPAPRPPSAVPAAEVKANALDALRGGRAPWQHWKTLAADLGEHQEAARLAFSTARIQMIDDELLAMAGELQQMGVIGQRRGGATMEQPLELVFSPREQVAAAGGSGGGRPIREQVEATERATDRARSGFRERNGADMERAIDARPTAGIPPAGLDDALMVTARNAGAEAEARALVRRRVSAGGNLPDNVVDEVRAAIQEAIDARAAPAQVKRLLADAATAGDAAALRNVTQQARGSLWESLESQANEPAPRQTAGGFRSNRAVSGRREVLVAEGPVGRQIPQTDTLADYVATLRNEHATHAIGMQVGENMPEAITSAPANLNLSGLKRFENALRGVAEAAEREGGARVETRTTLMVEHITPPGATEEVRVLVGIKREAWLVAPNSDVPLPFANFEARIDPVSRAVDVTRNEVRGAAKRRPGAL